MKNLNSQKNKLKVKKFLHFKFHITKYLRKIAEHKKK